MDVTDTAETIQEAVAEEAAAERARTAVRDRFRQRGALATAGLAMLLAISAVGGGNATKNMLGANILVSDTYAFYQAKTVRQTSVRLAQEQLELLLPTLPPEQQAAARARIDEYRATVARYESEPQTGEGKKELLEKAAQYVQQRDRAQRQDPNFDFSQALFQIAIVLGSVAIVAVSGRVLAVALGVGAIAALLMLNGFVLLVDLPIG